MDNHSTAELTSVEHGSIFSYAIILITFGTIGNVLLILTICAKMFKKHIPKERSTAVTNLSVAPRVSIQTRSVLRLQKMSQADQLLMMLTVSDLLCLWILLLRHIIFLKTDWDIRIANSTACKLGTFIAFVFTDLSVAILCIFSVHRALLIQCPLHSHVWLTRTKINIACLVAVVFILVKHIPVLVFFDNKSNDLCDLIPSYQQSVEIYYKFEFATQCILGYLIMIVANIILFAAFHCKKDSNIATHVGQAKQGESNAGSSSGRNIARILLCFSAIQLVTSVPTYIFIELSGVFHLELIPRNRMLLTYYICCLATLTNSGINYYLLLVVSTKFRKDTKNMYRALLHTCRPERRKQSTNSNVLLELGD